MNGMGDAQVITSVGCELPVSGRVTINSGSHDRVLPLDEMRGRRECWRLVEGDHGSSFLVRSDGKRLEMTGDPRAILRDHDLSEDYLPGLVYSSALQLVPRLGIRATDDDKRAWRRGEYRLMHVGLARIHEVESVQRARQLIASATRLAHERYQHVFNDRDRTLTVRRPLHGITLSLSSEDDNPRDHPLPAILAARCDETARVAGKLRVEVALAAAGLRARHLDRAAAWLDPSVVTAIIDEHVAQLPVADGILLDLPPPRRP